jgi:hypothetical protein
MIIGLASGPVVAQNWSVNPDGSGDLISLQAAIDSNWVLPGDTLSLSSDVFIGPDNINVDWGFKFFVIIGAGIDETVIDCAGSDRGFTLTSNQDDAELHDLTIRNGTATTGGGILIDDASPKITNVKVENCTADNGGGIYVGSAAFPTIQSCEITNCIATGSGGANGGGGISILNADMFLSLCNIHDNQGNNGGGILLTSSSGIYQNNLIHHNTATADGGGIKVETGLASLLMTNNLVYWNNAANGGGMYLESVASGANIENNTVAKNSASVDGAGLSYAGTGAKVEYTIVAFNTGTAPNAIDCGGVTSILECSIIWNPGLSESNSCGGIPLTNEIADPLFCNLGINDYHIAENSPATQANSICGGLVGALDIGCTTVSIDDETPLQPETFELLQNMPNPFNPTTMIQYYVPRESKVTLQIFNVMGILVKTLVNEVQGQGQKSMIWNGRNNSGQQVASGVYLYNLTAEGFLQTRKMILLK